MFYCSIDCLHPRGYSHRMVLGTSTEPAILIGLLLEPGEYYAADPRDGTMNRNKRVPDLGLGDFFFYNLMVLLVLPPLLPMTTKIYVAIGGIISVQVGFMATIWIATCWNVLSAVPAVPLPVITCSIYTILVDIFMQYSNTAIC
jgi:hypothetical protein